MKDFFSLWKQNSFETYDKILSVDFPATCIEQLVEKEECNRLKIEIFETMPVFIDIFHYLQTASKSYPSIDLKVIMDLLLTKMDGLTSEKFYMQALHSILEETAI